MRFRPADFSTGQIQSGKSLGAGHFLNEMAINIEERVAIIILAHDVSSPNLLV